MPSTAPAAAEGLPDYPRDSHAIGFVRELLMGWKASRANESTTQTERQESIMNQHVDRRALLASSALAIAATPAATAAAFYRAPLCELIAAHREALAVSEQLWKALGDIDDANNISIAKVQHGRLLIGRNADGTNEYKPLYSYSDKEIEKALEPYFASELAMCGSRKEWREQVVARFALRSAKLKTELREKQEEQAAAELACGYTAAFEAAKAASEVVDDRLDALLTYPLASLSDARIILAYLFEQLDAGAEGLAAETIANFTRKLAAQL